jgi:ribosome-binding protein aMBF1 (putative translation factor)
MDTPEYYLEHQDWKPYIIRKKKEVVKNTGGKKGPSDNLDSNDGKLKHKKVDKNFSKKITLYRLAKKWNQKTLGQKTNIKEDLIKKYENGTAIPTPQICNKLRRVLNIE